MKLVERTIDIDADPSTVYERFVDVEQFVRWMAPHAQIEPRPGGLIRWTHHNGDSCEGRFVELVPGRRIVFTYGWDRPDVEVPPGSTTVDPVARKALPAPQARSTATVSSVAGIIWQAMVRFQISSYRRRPSSSKCLATCAGVRSAEVGRIASCASCAFFDLVW